MDVYTKKLPNIPLYGVKKLVYQAIFSSDAVMDLENVAFP